jgi:hypothetical protein
MSQDELIAYFDGGGDVSELLRDAVRGPALGPAPAGLPMIVHGVRSPVAVVGRLDASVGDGEGGPATRS